MTVKTNARSSRNDMTYARGYVSDVGADNLATVHLSNSRQIRVRVDVMYGRTAPAREGEQWVLAYEFGDWRFVARVGLVPVEMRKFTVTLGNGTATSFTFDPGLGRDVSIAVYHATTGATIAHTPVRNTDGTITLTFTAAPATNTARVVVIG